LASHRWAWTGTPARSTLMLTPSTGSRAMARGSSRGSARPANLVVSSWQVAVAVEQPDGDERRRVVGRLQVVTGQHARRRSTGGGRRRCRTRGEVGDLRSGESSFLEPAGRGQAALELGVHRRRQPVKWESARAAQSRSATRWRYLGRVPGLRLGLGVESTEQRPALRSSAQPRFMAAAARGRLVPARTRRAIWPPRRRAQNAPRAPGERARG
jgi:hypothetical protein